MEQNDFETRTTEMVTISRAEYEADKTYISSLEQQVQLLAERLRLGNKKLYGSSSEKTQEGVMEQL